VLLADLRGAALQAAAAGGVDQFPRFPLARRVLEGGPAGAGTDGLRRFPRGADIVQPCGDGGRVAGRRAQPGAGDHGARRQVRAAIGEAQFGRRDADQAGGRGEFRPVQHVLNLGPVGPGVHRHRSADRAGDADEELQPAQPMRRGGFGDRHIERGGTGDDPVRFHLDLAEAAREADGDAFDAAVAHDHVGGRADHRQRRAYRQVSQQHDEVIGIRRPHQRVGMTADAEPGLRPERRILRHAPAQSRHPGFPWRVRPGRGGAPSDGGRRHHHFIAPASRPRERACSSVSCAGSAWAHCVMFPAPRQTT